MAQENIVNEDYQLSITELGGWTAGNVSGHTYIVSKSSVVKLSNKWMVTGISWVAIGCTFAPNNFVTGGGFIPTNCIKVFTQFGGGTLKETAQGVCIGSFTDPGGNPVPCSCTFEITDGGQTLVKGE